MIDEETIEEYTKRLAYNRWELRMHFKWKLHQTSLDDWNIAKEIVEKEIHGKISEGSSTK